MRAGKDPNTNWIQTAVTLLNRYAVKTTKELMGQQLSVRKRKTLNLSKKKPIRSK